MSAAAATGRVPATKPAPWAFAAPWRASGFVTDLDGPVHWIEFEGSGEPASDAVPAGTPIVFVHGLGGSHLNWCLIGPELAAERRAVALDLHGFGLTPGTRASSTVQRNRSLLDRFIREVVGTPVILAGNSMGGLISILQASTAPQSVRGLVLLDPALPVPPRLADRQVGSQFLMYALPGVGELYLRSVLSRRSPQVAVQQVVELCFADPSRIDPAMMTASIALAAERQANGTGAGPEAFLAASRSLMRVIGPRRRYWEMMASVQVPVLLVGGDADRLVPVASMRQAAARNPRWETVILPGVGHTPQLEVPGKVIGTMRDWLGRHFAPAAG
jgi:pimeloyl-ACP methyl ester carboxylesterase